VPRVALDNTLPICVCRPASILLISFANCALFGNPPRRGHSLKPDDSRRGGYQTAQRCRLAKHVRLQRTGHIPCRMRSMVASSANTSRPFAPAVFGRHRARLGDEGGDVFRRRRLGLGNEPALPDPAFCAEVTSPADFGLVGSPT